MRRYWKFLAILLLSILVLLLAGPFLIPVAPLQGTKPVAELADPDSQFIDVNGISIHYKEHGAGEPTFLLLHGFGASWFTWREVMAPLAVHGRIIAYDRPAFGLTERQLPGEWSGINPYSPEAQVQLAVGLLDALGVEQAVFFGSSAGGTVAVNTALTFPDRVRALVLVDAAVYRSGGAPAWIRPILSTPQMRRLGPLIARQFQTRGDEIIRMAWHDPSRVTPEILQGYRKPLQADHWDRALWELILATGELDLPDQLDELSLPVLVVTGDDDRIVPTELSIRLGQDIRGASLVVIENSGHLPHEETPQAFLDAVNKFIAGLEEE